jgi:hypothetical protein
VARASFADMRGEADMGWNVHGNMHTYLLRGTTEAFQLLQQDLQGSTR